MRSQIILLALAVTAVAAHAGHGHAHGLWTFDDHHHDHSHGDSQGQVHQHMGRSLKAGRRATRSSDKGKDGAAPRPSRCGIDAMDPAVLARMEESHKSRVASARMRSVPASTRSATDGGPFTAEVPVHFHVIKANATHNVTTDEQLQSQVEVLNKAYQPWGLIFKLASTQSLVHSEW